MDPVWQAALGSTRRRIREDLWTILPASLILLAGLALFELFIEHPEDTVLLFLTERDLAIPRDSLVAMQSVELPNRSLYFAASLAYTLVVLLGSAFALAVVVSGLRGSHTPEAPLRWGPAPACRSERLVEWLLPGAAVAAIVLLFLVLSAFAEDIGYIHFSVHHELLADITVEAGPGERPPERRYFADADWKARALRTLTVAHYLMGMVSGVLILLAFASCGCAGGTTRPAGAAAAEPAMAEAVRSQVRRLRLVALVGSLVIMSGVVVMGTRFEWTTRAITAAAALQAASAAQAGETGSAGAAQPARPATSAAVSAGAGLGTPAADASAFADSLVLYWAIVMSTMLVSAYLLVAWRLMARGAKFALTDEVSSIAALLSPIAGSLVTALLAS